MKVRWTETSIRVRITPTELETLVQGREIAARLAVPGGEWVLTVTPTGHFATLTMDSSRLQIRVSPAEIFRLAAPDTEGIYFKTPDTSPVRFQIEKDFPCLHPRAGEAAEQPTETFTPPAGFEQRKM